MNYKTKLSSIKLFAFDYDGVFTNGTVYRCRRQHGTYRVGP